MAHLNRVIAPVTQATSFVLALGSAAFDTAIAVNRPSAPVVQTHVLRLCNKLQVLRPIIVSYAVDMVHVLVPLQRSSDDFFHHNTMLEACLTFADRHSDISVAVYRCTVFPPFATLSCFVLPHAHLRAIQAFVARRFSGLTHHRSAAIRTRCVNVATEKVRTALGRTECVLVFDCSGFRTTEWFPAVIAGTLNGHSESPNQIRGVALRAASTAPGLPLVSPIVPFLASASQNSSWRYAP
jgi:hypothetical protein